MEVFCLAMLRLPAQKVGDQCSWSNFGLCFAVLLNVLDGSNVCQGECQLKSRPAATKMSAFPNTDPEERHPSDDGTHVVLEGKEELFAKWFHDNGGSYPKIQWPSRSTMGQVRGTIATEDILANEPMLYVPENIMISPPICRANPLIGRVFTENELFFARDDDTMLAVFVMFEKERGEASFWHPYLAMLPWPCSVADWSPTELSELQDRHLSQQATLRPIKLKEKYDILMALLLPKYENLFSKEVHTLEKYVFAWMVSVVVVVWCGVV